MKIGQVYDEERLRQRIENLEREIKRLQVDLLRELRCQLALANACCANASSRHCGRRIAELEAVLAAKEETAA